MLILGHVLMAIHRAGELEIFVWYTRPDHPVYDDPTRPI